MSSGGAGTVTDKQQAQQIGQGSFPAPKQMERSKNEQDIYSSVRPISGNANCVVDSSSDRENEVRNNRTKETESLFQDSKPGILGSNPAANSFSGSDARLDNRNADEVKNEQRHRRIDSVFGHLDFHRISGSSDKQEISTGIAPSARLSTPANQASFDVRDYPAPHVQNEQENNQSATCDKSEPNTGKQSTSQSREVAAFDLSIFCVDPIKSSANRWRIRIRCRKPGCKHSDHLHLKTISFMSDSVFKKLTRSERKYELWKKATIAENAGALRKSN